jgi:hypothetical protein
MSLSEMLTQEQACLQEINKRNKHCEEQCLVSLGLRLMISLCRAVKNLKESNLIGVYRVLLLPTHPLNSRQ